VGKDLMVPVQSFVFFHKGDGHDVIRTVSSRAQMFVSFVTFDAFNKLR
jgi:hypothetical protein